MLMLLTVVSTFNITFFVAGELYNNKLGNLTQAEDRYSKLKELAEIVETYFVGEIDEEAAIEGALAGYIQGLGDVLPPTTPEGGLLRQGFVAALPVGKQRCQRPGYLLHGLRAYVEQVDAAGFQNGFVMGVQVFGSNLLGFLYPTQPGNTEGVVTAHEL